MSAALRRLARTAAAVGATIGGLQLAQCEGAPTSLSKKEFRTFTVLQVKKLSSDTAKIVVALPSSEHVLGTETASCLSIVAEIDGQTVGRPYTPISTVGQTGTAEFVVKAYPARTDGKPGGMGAHLTSLTAGDTIKMKGPWKKFGYVANKYKRVGLIAGGTGLTPMLQVIQEILFNPADATKVTLLYANRSEEDILLRDRLDALASLYPTRFNVVYALDSCEAGWRGERGFVTPAMVEKHMPAASPSTKVMVCGPPPMMKAVSGNKTPKKKQGELSGALKAAGYTESMVFKF